MSHSDTKSSIFPQINLTSVPKFLENTDTYLTSSTMKGINKGAAVGAAMLSLSALEASADKVQLASSEQLLSPEVAEIVQHYEDCIDAAVAKASTMKTDKLKEKVFNGKRKGCDRQFTAHMGILEANEEQAELRAEQDELRAEQLELDNRIASLRAQNDQLDEQIAQENQKQADSKARMSDLRA